MRLTLAACLALGAMGCHPFVPSPPQPTEVPLFYAHLPAVRHHGAWHGAGRDGACTAGPNASCPAGSGVAVQLEVPDPNDPATSRVVVTLTEPVAIEAIAIEVDAQLPGATAWISNGFQSWSQSGALRLGDEPSEADTQAALHAVGDAETLRDGVALSWWFTAVGGGDWTLAANVQAPESQKAWIQVWRAPDAAERVRLRLVSGGIAPVAASPAGSILRGEQWNVLLWSPEKELMGWLAGQMAFKGRKRPANLLGWNSWYEFWDSTDENNARANFQLAKTAFAGQKSPSGNWLVLDDAWQKSWGDWTANVKFPSGLDGLAKDVKADGWHLGVWLAPFLVDAKSQLAIEHPDWFLQGASYLHLKNGEMKILDVTHPQAAEYLSSVFKQLVASGVELCKIDFLFAGLYEAPRFDGKSTSLQSYRRALQLMRDAVGPDIRLVAVGAPPTPTLEYVDGWRVGGDIALENLGAKWEFLPNQLRSLAARLPYCMALACDVDPPILRDLPPNEVEFGSWIAALAGGGLFLSDDLQKLPSDRLAQGLEPRRVSLALAGKVSWPQSMFPEHPPQKLISGLLDVLNHTSTQIVPTIWNSPDGKQVLVNAGDVTATVAGVVVAPHSVVAQ